MKQWIESQGHNQREVLSRLTKAKVRSGDNRRIGDTSSVSHSHDHGGVPSQGLQGVLATHNVHVPGAQYLNVSLFLSPTLFLPLAFSRRKLTLFFACCFFLCCADGPGPALGQDARFGRLWFQLGRRSMAGWGGR